MKRFFKTAAGKTVLVLVCIVFLLVLAACAGGAVYAVSADDGYFYLRSEEEAKENWITPRLRARAAECLYLVLNDRSEEVNDKDLYFVISCAANGVTQYMSKYIIPGEEQYSFFFAAKFGAGTKESGYKATSVIPWGESDGSRIDDVYVINMGILPGNSSWTLQTRFIHLASSLGWWIFAIAFAALIFALGSFALLMKVSARRPEREELVPGPLNAVPYDLMLAFGAAAVIGVAFFMDWIVPIDSSAELYLIIGAAVFGLLILIGLSVSAAARIKQRNLIRNTVIWRILKYLVGKPLAWLWKGLKKLHAFNMQILRNLPLVGKTAIIMGIMAVVFSVLEGLIGDSGQVFVFSLVKYLILIPIVLYLAICLRRLQKGGEALAAGNLSYQTETKGLPWDLKKHAENLNSIAGGMTAAVREQMKSERMKTELITNVSHDLKTPLTSLVNYAGLIAQEPSENPKITEYAEVLLRQSERMKRLIDDLVEASKASTGDLDVDLVPCDARVLLQQAAGEYEARLAAAGLTLVTREPEQEVRIMADGRRMWRVFDNLLNNTVKYALSGTRVYLDLAADGGDAVITFRNTSREPLAGNVEELTERFTRGDPSRNTEGSGLGLAIAKSLTELQGGKLSLTADGDLFKAVLRFPLALESGK